MSFNLIGVLFCILAWYWIVDFPAQIFEKFYTDLIRP